MIERGDIAEQKRGLIFGKVQHRTIALRDADTGVFDGKEIALVEQVLELFHQHNAKEISEISHRFAGWQLAAMEERIPYEVVLVDFREPTAAERAHGLKLAQSAQHCFALQSKN
jgi:hypothetical protein